MPHKPTSDANVTRLLACVCRNAPPRDVVAALSEAPATPASQRAVVRALRTAATLRGPPPAGYAASILTAVARCADNNLEDELAVALAAALSGDGANDNARALPPPPPGTEWRAYFFGDASSSSFPVIVAASRDFLAAGTGGAVWRAGGALAAALLARPTLVDGTALLELGCGGGLAGAVIAVAAGWVENGGGGGGGDTTPPRLAPASLTLTDGDSGALAIATATLAANGVRGVEVARLAWGGGGGGNDSASPPLDHHHPSAPPRLVIGADIMYDPEAAPALAGLLARLLSVPGSAALLAGVERAEDTVYAYTRALAAAGITVQRQCPPLAEGGGDCDDRLGPVWGEEDESGVVGWWWCRVEGK